MTSSEFCEQYWAHYISLEKEFANTLHYVSLSTENYSTFSEAYVKLMLEIGSEIDVLLKIYCKMLQNNFTGESIGNYQTCIRTNKNDFIVQEVDVCNTDIILKPWENWGETERKNPYWWIAYNKIKHERTDIGTINSITKAYYKFANLENTLSALAGLYQVLIYAYYLLANSENKRRLTPLPGSRIFTMVGDIWDSINFYGDFAFFVEEGELIYETSSIYY